MSQATEQKANRYLTEGRVVAEHVTTDRAEFTVAGSAAEPYRVRYFAGEWTCTCPAQITSCAHVFACQKITRIAPERQLFAPDADDLTGFLHDALHGR
jgi:uncharacterized Zn finger protein